MRTRQRQTRPNQDGLSDHRHSEHRSEQRTRSAVGSPNLCCSGRSTSRTQAWSPDHLAQLGLTEEDLVSIPPAEVRVFAFDVNTEKVDYGLGDQRDDPDDPANFLECGERPNFIKLPGTELGEIVLEDGCRVNAGRMIMRGRWNTALHGPLDEEGKKAPRPDVWIHKNRNSSLWNERSAFGENLKKEGIRILLFSGVNTDQCVGATLQDAHAQGFHTIMLKDGCGTDSLPYAKATYEFNCARCWGFLTSCKALEKAAGLDY